MSPVKGEFVEKSPMSLKTTLVLESLAFSTATKLMDFRANGENKKNIKTECRTDVSNDLYWNRKLVFAENF